MEKPQVSIIVPVYNVKDYLPRCLDSLISQSLKSIEIVAIDDGSSDGSSLVLDTYAANDERIRVFHVENGGVSRARNIGLDKAKGEYIGFVDSDDYVEPQMFENLVKVALDTKADCVQCSFDVVSKDSMASVSHMGANVTIMENHDEIVKSFFEGKIENSVWNKLYRRSDLDKVSFPLGWTFAEDFYFNAMFIVSCKRVAFTDDVLYHYYSRGSSASREAISDKHLIGFSVYDMVKQKLADEDVYSVVAEKEVSESLRFLDSSIGHKEISSESLYGLIGRIRSGKRWIRGNRYLSPIGRVRARAVCLMPRLYVCIVGIFKKLRRS